MNEINIEPVWTELFKSPARKVLKVSQDIFDQVNAHINYTQVETDASTNPLSLGGYRYYSNKYDFSDKYLVSESIKGLAETYYYIYSTPLIDALIIQELQREYDKKYTYFTLVEYYKFDKKNKLQTFRVNFKLSLKHEITSNDIELLRFYFTLTSEETGTSKIMPAAVIDYRRLVE